jgi:oligopeptide/dipeptide ABC transporter ATP-binding protein
VKAVDGISFAIAEGETYSLVGETGCGKTTTARLLLLVGQPTGGDILFRGKSVKDFSKADKRLYRSTVQAVFQDPWSSLNPRMRIEDIVAEPLQATRRLGRREVRSRVGELLEQVGLSPSAGRRFPHEFSGGQRQRIAIARALSPDPRLIILDEPVSSLDVSIRAQIMNLLKELQRRLGVSYLLIAHDLATVRFMSDKVAVMYLGRIVEEANAVELFTNPQHPYTRALLAAALPSRPGQKRSDAVLTGEVPSPVNVPLGCAFHPRCPFAMPQCSVETPENRETSTGHLVACHLY